MPIVEAVGLEREFRSRRRSVRALDGLDFTLDAGAFVALLGPNGSGKSTLIRTLVGADVPDKGSAKVFGIEAHKLGPARARLGVVFQSPSLDPLLTGRENLYAHAAILGRPTSDALAAAELVGVTDRLDDRVGTLSGGLVRRVDLARAVLHEPELIILDEPTTGLDHDARAAFLETLATLHRERAVTVLLSTHLMDEAERADTVVLVNKGRVAAAGAPDELRRRLGRHVVRTADSPEARALADGLDIETTDRGLVISGDESRVGELVRAFVEGNLAFEFGPPTLGDVYLHETGTRLAEGGAP